MKFNIDKSLYKEFEIEKLAYGISEAISKKVLHDARLSLEDMGEAIGIRLKLHFPSCDVTEFNEYMHKYPKNWVEALKERIWRWIPQFIQRKYPIEYEKIQVRKFVNVCPHIAIPDDKVHLAFLIGNKWKKDYK